MILLTSFCRRSTLSFPQEMKREGQRTGAGPLEALTILSTGSTAYPVVSSASCPVFTVPKVLTPTDFTKVMGDQQSGLISSGVGLFYRGVPLGLCYCARSMLQKIDLRRVWGFSNRCSRPVPS